MSKITDEELAAMPPKSVRYPEEVKLYQENDFMTAYGLHTDKRIRETSYKHAIGGGENWEEHGKLQRDFLIKRGLKMHHSLLDIGCGTGRLARKIVPYLESGRYVGIDISKGALAVAEELAWDEHFAQMNCEFIHGDLPEVGCPFDFAWAFSVFIHLPIEVVADVMRRVGRRLRGPDSQFLFSYVPNERSWRSGLKQFRHTLEDYQTAMRSARLTFEEVPDWVYQTIGSRPDWAGHQRVACARRKP